MVRLKVIGIGRLTRDPEVSIPYRYGTTIYVTNNKGRNVVVSIPYRYGTTEKDVVLRYGKYGECQFLIGMVRQESWDSPKKALRLVSIPYRYGTTR